MPDTPQVFCYIISLVHTPRRDAFISFWRPDNSGYAWPLSWAGKYPLDKVLANPSYYNDGYHTLAVLAGVVDALSVKTPPGYVDGDAGPVVGNNHHNWKILLSGVVFPPKQRPLPQYKGAPVYAVGSKG